MQFRPVVSAIRVCCECIFKKLHSKKCGYLLIIRHLANKKISTTRGEAVLFLPACSLFHRAISSSVLFVLVIAPLTLLSHANSISLLIYTSLNYSSLSFLFHSSRVITDFA